MDENLEQINSVPKEVTDFIFNDEFSKLIDESVKEFFLNEDQKREIRYLLEELLLENISAKEFENEIKNVFSSIISKKLLDILNRNIIQTAYNKVIDGIKKDDRDDFIEQAEASIAAIEKGAAFTVEVSAPSPKDMIDRLSQTLQQPTTIAPIRRDYSLEKGDVKSVESVKKPLDPYREMPN